MRPRHYRHPRSDRAISGGTGEAVDGVNGTKDSIIVFDMDGVLAEVTESYREAIVQTVEHFTGQRIERDRIQDYKNQGGWNNDWALSQKIASDLGVEIPYGEVVDYFNQIFIGKNGDGLINREQW